MTSVARRSGEDLALLLRRTDYGDSDLIVSLLTRKMGRVDAIARAARKSHKRFAGGFEPFHVLAVVLDEPAQGSLFVVREAHVQVPRFALTQHLRAMTAAGRALGWVRLALPARSAEPQVFDALQTWLEHLDEHPPSSSLDAEASLGQFGLSLLSMLGWALEFERCVRCGRVCPTDKSGTLDPRRGGLVCRNCGGGPVHLTAALRTKLRCASAGTLVELDPADASLVLDIVEQTLRHHPGVAG